VEPRALRETSSQPEMLQLGKVPDVGLELIYGLLATAGLLVGAFIIFLIVAFIGMIAHEFGIIRADQDPSRLNVDAVVFGGGSYVLFAGLVPGIGIPLFRFFSASRKTAADPRRMPGGNANITKLRLLR